MEQGGWQSSSWRWDHIAQVHGGKGSEEPHQDFDFYPSSSFRKPLERQVDEARRIDRAEEVGKAMFILGGKRKEIRVNKVLLNRKEERSTLAMVW